MGLTDNLAASRYASISENAAAEAKSYADRAALSEDFADKSQESAEASAQAAIQAETAKQDAILSSESSAASADSSLASANEAAISASQAEGYGDNKYTYPDTASGLAGTISGQYFRVPQGVDNEDSFVYYLNNSGVAEESASLPGTAALSAVLDIISTKEQEQLGVLRDQFGWLYFKWLRDGGFGSGNVFMGSEIIKNNILSITANDSGTVVFKDPYGWVYPLTGTNNSGWGSDPEEAIKVRDTQNKLYAENLKTEVSFDIASPVYDYNVIVSYGQSISTGYEGWPALTKVAREINNLIMLGQSVRGATRAGTYSALGGNAFNDMISVVQSTATPTTILSDSAVAALPRGASNEGEDMMVGAINFWRAQQLKMRALSSDPSRKIIGLNVGVAGMTVEQLSKGASTGHYENRFIKALTDLKSTIPSGKTVGLVGIIYVGNEYNYDASWGGTTDKDTYKALLRALLTSMSNDAASILGYGASERPAKFTVQPGASYTRDVTNMSIGNAHLELSREYDDIFLCGTYYQVTDKANHLSPNGYRWVGQKVGQVMHQVLDRRINWFPTQPISATCQGTNLLLDLALPKSAAAFAPAYYLTTGGTIYPNKGFRVTDSSGQIDITDTSYAADTIAKLTLSRAPVSTPTVWYAPQTTYNGNGNVCDSDTTKSLYLYEYHEGTGQYPEENIPALVDKPYDLRNFSVAYTIQAEMI